MRDQAVPFPAARGAALVVEQQLPALADADREFRELGGAHRRDVGVVDQPSLEALASGVHVGRERVGQWQPEIPHHDGRDAADRVLGRRELGGMRSGQRAGVQGEGQNDSAAAAAGDGKQSDQQRGREPL